MGCANVPELDGVRVVVDYAHNPRRMAAMAAMVAAIARPGGELESVRDAIRWARPGDLRLLTVHQDRPAVLALLEQLRVPGWRMGQPLPASD